MLFLVENESWMNISLNRGVQLQSLRYEIQLPLAQF
jgi:hypothetical protein